MQTLLRTGSHFGLTAALALCAAPAAFGCGGSEEGAASATSGGSAGVGDAGSGSGNEGGSSSLGVGGGHGGSGGLAGADNAGGASGDCPLDEVARTRTEAIVRQSLAEAAWVTNQTHGVGMFASRGFGFAIPSTTVGSIMSLTLAEACTGPKTFDEYCQPADPGLEAAAGPCSQLECVAAGELAISLWYDPLPFTTPEDPPPGAVEVTQAEQFVEYTEQEDGSVTIGWATTLELMPSESGAITIGEAGNAVAAVEAGESSAAATVTIGGLSARADLVVEFESSAAGATGVGTIQGEQIFEVTHDEGVVWGEACSAP